MGVPVHNPLLRTKILRKLLRLRPVQLILFHIMTTVRAQPLLHLRTLLIRASMSGMWLAAVFSLERLILSALKTAHLLLAIMKMQQSLSLLLRERTDSVAGPKILLVAQGTVLATSLILPQTRPSMLFARITLTLPLTLKVAPGMVVPVLKPLLSPLVQLKLLPTRLLQHTLFPITTTVKVLPLLLPLHLLPQHFLLGRSTVQVLGTQVLVHILLAPVTRLCQQRTRTLPSPFLLSPRLTIIVNGLRILPLALSIMVAPQ